MASVSRNFSGVARSDPFPAAAVEQYAPVAGTIMH
jgi:hypothetical protein